MNSKTNIGVIEGIGLNTSNLLAMPSKSQNHSLVKEVKAMKSSKEKFVKKRYINIITFEKKYKLLDVPKGVDRSFSSKKSLTPSRTPSSSSRGNLMHGYINKSFSLASSKQSSRSNLKESNTSYTNFSLPKSLQKINSSNLIYSKNSSEKQLVKPVLDELTKRENISRSANISPNALRVSQKSDIEKILESQQSSKRHTPVKQHIINEIPSLNLSKISAVNPIVERSLKSEDSPAKKNENEKPKRILSSSTSRYKLKLREMPFWKLQKIFRNSVKGEQVLENIINYEQMFSSNRNSEKRKIKTPENLENLKISNENYQEVSLRALKNTSSFAEKIMKQIRCPSRCKIHIE
ncbi:unnamed protein product [Blepharisma stoltei]|uniref:Uncharacterized protein n=1 Tax=Blepharisma stoltei TaxID=1481888 RepID=A0AAU9I801_9CILI|nr:unnamed protein product [Blepharisma stoltei]